jgi:hypothetical protein
LFIIDDILLAPAKSMWWLFKEIHKAAAQEMAADAELLTRELSDLYRQLERGEITEAQFDEREEQILELLDAMEQAADDHIAEDPEEDSLSESDTVSVGVLAEDFGGLGNPDGEMHDSSSGDEDFKEYGDPDEDDDDLSRLRVA